VKTTINIYEAKASLSKLVATVLRTQKPLAISRNGVPVVDLVPHRKTRDALVQDPHLLGAVFVGDPASPADDMMWPPSAR
jgi:prevent-host-death family protein